MNLAIRPAAPADFPALEIIEADAAEAFRAIGWGDLCGHGCAREDFQRGIDTGLLLLAEFPETGPAGFALLWRIGAHLHLRELDVLRRQQRRGIGRALIANAAEWATRHGIEALTLTTYRDIPWNAPGYQRLGFSETDPESLPEALRSILHAELALATPERPRVAMLKPLP